MTNRDAEPARQAAARVPETANLAAEIPPSGPSRWDWVEPQVWTARMVAALDRGVRGGKWHSLRDKVYAPRTLAVAWERVRRNAGSAGVDRQSVAAFESQAERYLGELHVALRDGRYHPQPVRRQWIPKASGTGQRPLGIPTVTDRIVQTALKLVLEPIWEADFADQSYGFRPGRGCKDALRAVANGLAKGQMWVVDADIRSYFDTIPHALLQQEIEQRVADGWVLGLLRQYLTNGVLDGMAVWQPEAGTPQGAVISPVLANLYLNSLDHRLAAQGYTMVRYADDFVVLCGSQSEAEAALATITGWLDSRGLTLHPEKTRIVDARVPGEGFDFLGYHFERGTRWPRKQSRAKVRQTVRKKTRRTTGQNLGAIIADLNPVLRGWYGYFKHSRVSALAEMDGWVRRRLRSILRHQAHQRGMSGPADHRRWPNAVFTGAGLFTLHAAWRREPRPH